MSEPRLSIVIPVLESVEIVRRQLLHFSSMQVMRTGEVEFIIMDDGSKPPLWMQLDYGTPSRTPMPNQRREQYCNCVVGSLSGFNTRIVQTNDYRPWTWALARNAGAKLARGQYLLMTDIDYIIPEKAILECLAFNGDKIKFKREFGVLDRYGKFTQEMSVLKQYGLDRAPSKGVSLPPHPNNFCIRKDIFWTLGGYREDLITKPYPQGEDRHFKRVWQRAVNSGKYKDHEYRPMLYMFPNGQFCVNGDVDYNPMGLFHTLKRNNPANPWLRRQRTSK